MSWFLAKADPGTYGFADLEREKRTVWDGVANPAAVKAIRSMKKGDRVLIYHSGGESAIVGLARVISEARPDPRNSKSWVVEFECGSRLEPPTTLSEVKATGKFSGIALVRQGRLSTMAMPEEFIDWLRARYPTSKL